MNLNSYCTLALLFSPISRNLTEIMIITRKIHLFKGNISSHLARYRVLQETQIQIFMVLALKRVCSLRHLA